MALSKFERMIQLVTEVFDVKNDPAQLDVGPEVIARLQEMHPSSLSEYNEGDGPAAWILLIPTTTVLMNEFISGQITEQQLFDQTPVGASYEVVYLCSATVLPEYRSKGIARQLAMDAINSMRQQHSIKALFVWPFSEGGDTLAENIARSLSLPLLKKDA